MFCARSELALNWAMCACSASDWATTSSNGLLGSVSRVPLVTALTVKSHVSRRLDQRLVAEVVAVGQHLEHRLVAVLAGADLVRPCRGR